MIAPVQQFEDESGSDEHHVDLISDDSLVVIAGETVIFFQVSDHRFNARTLAEVLSLYILLYVLNTFVKDLGMWMSVFLTLLLPRYPLSQIPFRGFLSVNFSTCSIALSNVCPSNSFLKLSAPTITPVPVCVMDTLFPNLYCLCSFPLLMHYTSTSSRE